MKLDQQTITWIEAVAGEMAHGDITLVVCDKQVVKIITEDRRVHVRKSIDKGTAHHIGSA
jgi:hypothetical protein